jgi:hypothetical protein
MVAFFVATISIIIVALLWLRKTHAPLPIVSHTIVVSSRNIVLGDRTVLMEGETKRLSVVVIALLENGRTVAINLRRRFLLVSADPMIVDTDWRRRVRGVSCGESKVLIKSKHPLVMPNEIIGSKMFVVPASPFSVEIIMVSGPIPVERR